jgi:HPr kinase/phosphorylase
MTARRSVHASAVKVGSRAVLIRGPSGSGKSRLAFDLILSGQQLLVRPVSEIAGLIEIRGLGIRRCEFTGEAEVGLVVDLQAHDAERLPPPEALRTSIFGVEIPRIPVGSGFLPLPLVVAALTTAAGLKSLNDSDDCLKGIGNHITPTLATE